MTTSDSTPKELYVWVWLPGATEPVVAGRLYRANNRRLHFNYGSSYLNRSDAIPLYEPELPLRKGSIPPLDGLAMAGSLRDGSPDAWGRRVIIHRLMGKASRTDSELDELTYMLQSGSDRIGALDFQLSPTEYIPRGADNATLEELMEASDRVEKGLPLTPELDQVLNHGSSIGGARPKALIQEGDTKYVAKFSSTSDHYNVVKGEYVAMRLAELAGLNVAPVRLEESAKRDVLLVERFDRAATPKGFQRRMIVSALTLFELDELMARYAGYDLLADIIRQRFSDVSATLRELYKRLVFNVLTGNTDDHARNHAAFWDGQTLALTPAYDICPQNRTTGSASQAMRILGTRNDSRLSLCEEAAYKFNIKDDDAEAIIETMRETITQSWETVCDEAQLTNIERQFFWERQFLNPSINE